MNYFEEAKNRIEKERIDKTGFLDLSSLRLKELPSEIQNLGHLIKLDISFNKIQEISDELVKLNKLKILHCYNNKIQLISNDIGKLTELTDFNIANNQIDFLPNSIGNLVNLNELNLFNNELDRLPLSLHKLKKLNKEGIDLRENNFQLSEKHWFHELNASSLIQLILDEQQGGVRSLNEAKVVFIGNSNVGKTSLIQKLINRNIGTEPETTKGINVEEWKTIYNGNQVKVSVWDFGGQEIMHSTHQFFLTRRTIYVLVCQARVAEQEDNALRYWLNLIGKLGNNSPVIICANKIDLEANDFINRKGWKEDFPFIKSFLRTSIYKNQSIDNLENEIAKIVHELPLVRERLPQNWFKIKNKLENYPKGFIRQSEYVEMIGSLAPELSHERQIYFLEVLISLGIIFFYDGNQDHHLKNYGIIKPKWLTKVIYLILHDPVIQGNHGEVTLEDVNRVLALNNIEHEYPTEIRRFVLELMYKFELAYPIFDKVPKFIIPDLLPPEEPDSTLFNFHGDKLINLISKINYGSFLPRSVLIRFIVKWHKKLKSAWRDGLVIMQDESVARIRMKQKKYIIQIEIKGENKLNNKLLYRDIINSVGDIHKEIFDDGNAPPQVEIDFQSNSYNYFDLHRSYMKYGDRIIPWVNNDTEINPKQILDLYFFLADDEKVELTKDKKIELIKRSVKDSKIEDALSLLGSIPECENNELTLSQSYKELKEQQIKGTVSFETYLICKNKIVSNILDCVGTM